jgi:hypothetical protein
MTHLPRLAALSLTVYAISSAPAAADVPLTCERVCEYPHSYICDIQLSADVYTYSRSPLRGFFDPIDGVSTLPGGLIAFHCPGSSSWSGTVSITVSLTPGPYSTITNVVCSVLI